jgi:hypothetical protein
MSVDPTGTQNTAPALRLIATTDPAPIDSGPDPTGTRNTDPALRLIATTDPT